MERYTTSITVSIKSTGTQQCGSTTTTKSIRIPIIKPRPILKRQVTPFSDLSNIRSESHSASLKSPLHHNPVSPPTNTKHGDDYTIKRAPLSTRLFLVEDQGASASINENVPSGFDFITGGNFIAAFEGFANAWRMVHS